MKILLLHRESHTVVAFASVAALRRWLREHYKDGPAFSGDPEADADCYKALEEGKDWDGGALCYEWTEVQEG